MKAACQIIPRPTHMPPIRVLEVDGPRRKYVQRGEGSYYLCTDNHPPITDFMNPGSEPVDLTRFKDWGEPCWEIYLNNDRTVEIHACRPSLEEVIEGDMHGEFGSVIRLRFVARHTVKNGLWLARKLTTCDPVSGIVVPAFVLASFSSIETNIPVYSSDSIQP